MDHPVQRPLRLPHFLHPECEDLGIRGGDPLPGPVRLPQRAPRPLGEHGDPACKVGRLGIVRRRLALPVEARWRRPDAADPRPVHQQRIDRESGEEVHPQALRLLAQPADHLRERGGEIAMIAHGRGSDRQLVRTLRGQEVHRLARHRLTEGKIRQAHLREELLEGTRVYHRARQAVLTQCPRLFQHRDVEVGHPTARLLVLPDQAGKLDRTGQPRRPGADDHDIHFERLGAGGVGRDQAVDGQGGLVANRENAGQTGAP